MYLETSSYLAALFYNVFKGSPFSTYGDYIAPIVQNLIIISLIWLWGINKKPFTSTHIFTVIFFVGLFSSIIVTIPNEFQQWIMSYSIIIMMISRLPQIISNFTTGKVGVQSTITLTNGVIGATAKTFIIFVETKDLYLIIGSVLSLILNLTLLLQILYLQYVDKQNHNNINSSSSSSNGSTTKLKKSSKKDK